MARSLHAKDVRAITSCKATAGTSARSCGLVFRYSDEQNHRVARVDLDEQAVIVSSVSEGLEQVLTSAPVALKADAWQEALLGFASHDRSLDLPVEIK